MVADTLAAVDRLRTHGTESAAESKPKALVRIASAFYGHPTLGTTIAVGADVSVTVRLTSTIKRAIESIDDEDTDTWISRAEIAEIPFTAFASERRPTGSPGVWSCAASPTCVRRRTRSKARCSASGGSTRSSPPPTPRTYLRRGQAPPSARDRRAGACGPDDLRPRASALGQVHREQAWPVFAVMAFNLTPATGTLTGDRRLAKATIGTVRHTIVSVPARIAYSARRFTLHLPTHWPWETEWITLFDNAFGRSNPIIV